MSRQVNELPYAARRELCRVLDNGEDWRELAGLHMKYSVFEINEIANESRQQSKSPSAILLERWGHHIHNTNELFVLLYRMRHVPAMRCIQDCVDAKCLLLLKKLTSAQPSHLDRNSAAGDTDSVTSIPLPVQAMGKVQLHDQVVRRSQDSTSLNSPSTETDNSDSTVDSGGDVNAEFMRFTGFRIPYRELCDATDSWASHNLLGNGGYGVVYKGEWKQTLVAIKRLKTEDKVMKEFLRELCLNEYRHDNLLPLYGYSVEGPWPCLVYQLMLGGSLQQRLRCKPRADGFPPLTWPQRHKIALGIARGLQFLHSRTSTALIHGDIKPANILLDPCNEPKIGDFGLARSGALAGDSEHVVVSKVQGTRSYLPEDYIRSHQLSTAVDVFSFGLVLCELATALRVFDPDRREPWLRDYLHKLHGAGGALESLEDPALPQLSQSAPDKCRQFLLLGLACTRAASAERPGMIQVYQALKAMTGPVP